jgi:hypothetical protein
MKTVLVLSIVLGVGMLIGRWVSTYPGGGDALLAKIPAGVLLIPLFLLVAIAARGDRERMDKDPEYKGRRLS